MKSVNTKLYLFKIHFNIIYQIGLVFLNYRFFPIKISYPWNLPQAYYIPPTFHQVLLDHVNYFWWTVQIMKLIMHFFRCLLLPQIREFSSFVGRRKTYCETKDITDTGTETESYKVQSLGSNVCSMDSTHFPHLSLLPPLRSQTVLLLTHLESSEPSRLQYSVGITKGLGI
jgi:hypothetical protein